jgi:mRNA interferase MazF
VVIHRGEIWWASLPEPAGSGPGYRRPLLVIQSNDFNESTIRTIVSVPVTSNAKLAAAPGNVLLPRRITGLSRDSVANVSQVFPASRTFFTQRIGALPQELLRRIEEGLRLVMRL